MATAQPALQTADIDQALAYFAQTKKRIFDVASGLTDAQWQFKPAPDRWSIAENLEHMVTVEETILGPIRQQLAQAPPQLADRNSTEVDRIVLEKFPDRTVKAKAPEFLNPTGQCTLSDALERVTRNYRRVCEYVVSAHDLREHTVDAPPLNYITNGAYTTMDGYQWALGLAAHDERHIRQIAELQADPNYPQRG
jgi:hypothetical protein